MDQHEPTRNDRIAPPEPENNSARNVTNTSFSPDLRTARELLHLLCGTEPDDLERLVVAAAIGHIEDVFPPYLPCTPTQAPRSRSALRDEAIQALRSVITAPTAEPDERSRASAAMHELLNPIAPEAAGTSSWPAPAAP